MALTKISQHRHDYNKPIPKICQGGQTTNLKFFKIVKKDAPGCAIHPGARRKPTKGESNWPEHSIAHVGPI
jgi:hypothetical protein